MAVATSMSDGSAEPDARRSVEEPLGVRALDGTHLSLWRSYDPARAGPGSPAVVLCHGFVQNRLAFQSRARSLTAHLRALGLVVYAVELRGRDGGHAARGLVDYVELDAPAAVARAREDHREVAWVGHSMGGIIGTLLPPDVAALLHAVVAVGAPLLPGRPGLHARPTTSAAVRAARLAHAPRRPFRGRRWGQTLWRLRHVLDDPGVPNPLRVWAPRSLDDDSLTFALQHSFAEDSWAVFADMLELLLSDAQRAGDIDVSSRLASHMRPLLVLAGNADDLAPPHGVQPLFARSGAGSKEYIEVGDGGDVRVGHIDLLIGQAAPRLVWAPLGGFLLRHLAPHTSPQTAAR